MKTLIVYGDGVHDDTQALQEFLNGTANLVFPDGEKWIGGRKRFDQDWGNGKTFKITKQLVVGDPI